MIPSIHKPGSNTAGAIGYLYRTGRGHEAHTDPHLVASLDGLAPDPGRNPDATFKQLAAYLDLPVNAIDPAERPDKPVWHCSVRAAPEDPILTDTQWADIARRMVAATGIAPEGDDGACRWIAVRHADDHIHILATKVRQDGTKPRDSYSYKRAQTEARQIETDYGLRRVASGDGTAAKRPTRAETEKAHRTGSSLTAREQLRTALRTTVAAAASPEEFLRLLAASGIKTEILRMPSGDIRGYKVALAGDTNAAGEPVWFAGSTLAPDLSYPKIRARLTGLDPRQTNPWHQATAATEGIPHHLDQHDDASSQAYITVFAEALDVLPLTAPQELRPLLRQTALDFERASRSRIQADHQHARALRGAVRAIARQPPIGDGAALAMLLDAAILAAIAIRRWYSTRHLDQQVEATRRTLNHLQTAYDQAAAAPLAALATRLQPATTLRDHEAAIRQAVPAYANQIIADPAWSALATTLTDAQASGHALARLLHQAADHRALTDARSPARVLLWRVQRLSLRSAPNPRTQAALARSASVSQTHNGAPPQAPVQPNLPAATDHRPSR